MSTEAQLEKFLRALLLADPEKRKIAYRVLQGELPTSSSSDAYPLLMTVADAAKLLGVSRGIFYRLIHAGTIRTFEVTPGFVRIRREDVVEFAASDDAARIIQSSTPRRKPHESLHHHPDPGP
jgi:excisionase family DNA binding protein